MKKLIVSLSPACNLRCKYCYVQHEEGYFEAGRKNQLATLIEEVIAFLSLHPETRQVQFLGGEPTIQLCDLEAICNAIVVAYNELTRPVPKLTLVTNGVWKDRQRVLQLIKRFSMGVTISLDGPEDIHNSLRVYPRGRGSYAQVWESMAQLRSEGIFFSVESVITSIHLNSRNSIADLMELCVRAGASKLYFDPAYPPAPDELLPLTSSRVSALLDVYRIGFGHWYDNTIGMQRSYLYCFFNDITRALIEGKALFSDVLCSAGCDVACVDHNVHYHDCNLFIGYDSAPQTASFQYPRAYSQISECSACSSRYWCKVCPAINGRFGSVYSISAVECQFKKGLIALIAERLHDDSLLTCNELTRPLINAR